VDPDLGREHQAERRAQLAALTGDPGRPCPRWWICRGAPMFATPAEAAAAGMPRKLWAVDLDDWPGRVFGGPQVKLLAHAHCNRSAGGTLGNRLRGARRALLRELGLPAETPLPPANRRPRRRTPRW
jgi:hypothetical protein